MKVTLSLTITRKPKRQASSPQAPAIYATRTYSATLEDAHEIERQHGTEAAMDAVDSGRATWRTPTPASYWTEGNASSAASWEDMPCNPGCADTGCSPRTHAYATLLARHGSPEAILTAAFPGGWTSYESLGMACEILAS